MLTNICGRRVHSGAASRSNFYIHSTIPHRILALSACGFLATEACIQRSQLFAWDSRGSQEETTRGQKRGGHILACFLHVLVIQPASHFHVPPQNISFAVGSSVLVPLASAKVELTARSSFLLL